MANISETICEARREVRTIEEKDRGRCSDENMQDRSGSIDRKTKTKVQRCH